MGDTLETVRYVMKKSKLFKLLTLVICFAVSVTAFTGCLFNYEEETDLSQEIVEIMPFDIDYLVPIMTDYLNPDGEKVYGAKDEDGEYIDIDGIELKNGVVQTVLYDHLGNVIKKPVIENGAPKEDGARDVTTDTFVVVYDVSGNDVSATEYEFKGKVGDFARWQKANDQDAEYVYGAIKGNTAPTTNTLAGLPEITYKSSEQIVWNKPHYVYETAKYKYEGEAFYKTTLVNYFEQYGAGVIQERSYDIDELFDYFVKNLYTAAFTQAEQGAAVASGDLVWGVTEINKVNKSIYDAIDTVLQTIYAEISKDNKESYPEVGEPVAPEVSEKDEAYSKDYEVWHISLEKERCVGTSSDDKINSLRREGVRRFVDHVADTLDSDRAISATEREKFTEELGEMQVACASIEGVDNLYKNFYKYELIRHIYGGDEFSIKTQNYKDYIARSRNITTDTKSVYEDKLDEQLRADYATTASGDDTVLYFENNDYFWVKHILIQFSQEEQDYLKEYKEKHTSAEYYAKREQMGALINVNKQSGNDTETNYSIADVWAEIYSQMDAVKADSYSAERKFNELIELYNQDPGIADREMGYAVTAKSEKDGGPTESYMIEFATEARALYGAYLSGTSLYEYKKANASKYTLTDYDSKFTANVNIGSISGPILTDYGWHIMYLCYVPNAGYTRSLTEYLTAGQYTTVEQALANEISSSVDKEYTSWQGDVAKKYESKSDSVIVIHKDRFAQKLEDYENSFYDLIKANKEKEAEEAEQANK